MAFHQKLILSLLIFPGFLLGENPYALQETLNQKLDQALQQEQELDNSALEENLGDLWKELNDLPRAVLHYSRSLRLDPSNEEVLRKLQETRRDLFINAPSNEQQALFAKTYLDQRYMLPAFAVLFFIGFLLKSMHAWGRMRKPFLFRLCFFLSAIPLISAAFMQYAVPHSAVILVSTPLYRAPSTQVDLAGDAPLPSGSQAVVLQVEKEGTWLKIETEKGEIGFIPYTKAGII